MREQSILQFQITSSYLWPCLWVIKKNSDRDASKYLEVVARSKRGPKVETESKDAFMLMFDSCHK